MNNIEWIESWCNAHKYKTRLEKEVINLLKEFKKTQKENEELRKKLYLCTPEIPQNSHDNYISYVDLVNKLNNSISKDKVKAKIEELKKEKVRYPYIQQFKIETLQSLLESEKQVEGFKGDLNTLKKSGKYPNYGNYKLEPGKLKFIRLERKNKDA